MDAVMVVVVAAQTSPGEHERLHDVRPVVCIVDCSRRRFDWFPGHPPSHSEDSHLVFQAIERLVAVAVKETNWWRNTANEETKTTSERSLHGFVADLSNAIDWNTQLSASEVLQGFKLLDATALLASESDSNALEAAITNLQASPRSMRSLQRRVPDSVYKLSLLVVYEVLRRHTLVLDQPERFAGTFRSFVHDATAGNCMRLNPAARKVLTPSTASQQSIFGVISRACSTNRGRKCLQKWFDRPCADAEALRTRHDTVQTFVHQLSGPHQASSQDSSLLGQIAHFFRHLQAFESKLETFATMRDDSDSSGHSGRLSLSSFVDLAHWIRVANDVVARQSPIGGLDADGGCLEALRHDVTGLLPLCTLIQQVVDPTPTNTEFASQEATASDFPAASTTLRELRFDIQQCKDEISAAVSQAAEALHLQPSRIRVLYDEDDQPGFPTTGVVLRVSRQDGHRVHRLNGKLVTVFKASRATGVWFSVPVIDTLGARWKVLKDRYDAAEQELVRLIVSAFHDQYQRVLANVMREAGDLDVLLAFALVSSQHGFTRASISDSVDAVVELVAPFSPFIPDKRRTQDWSIRLDQKHRFLLLEGEEVAGDAPLLHLVGTIAVLNQIGCFVPCERARLPLFDAVLLRGGAYDQQLFGFSTFMTEMKEVALILENLTPKSLVLIDDLCRGTASSEGLALATSICSHFIEKGVCVCFSSQWRELTSQVEALQGVTVPKTLSSPPRPERRRSEENRRFGQLLIDAEMPRELIEFIQQELKH